jgi:hypothetical protein
VAQDEATGHILVILDRHGQHCRSIDKHCLQCYLLVMKKKTTTRTITAVLACLVLGCAFFAVPVVHKHVPTQQVPLQDYDASCYFAKAEKNSLRGPSQQVMVCVAFLLFFTVILPFIERRTEVDISVRSLFTRNVQSPRAPPQR